MKRIVSFLAVFAFAVTAQADFVDITGNGGDTMRVHVDYMGTDVTTAIGGLPIDMYKVHVEALNPVDSTDYVKAIDMVVLGPLYQVGAHTWVPPQVIPPPTGILG